MAIKLHTLSCGDEYLCVISFNRRYRRQQILQSMLWKVRLEEIDFVTALMCGSVRVRCYLHIHMREQPVIMFVIHRAADQSA